MFSIANAIRFSLLIAAGAAANDAPATSIYDVQAMPRVRAADTWHIAHPPPPPLPRLRRFIMPPRRVISFTGEQQCSGMMRERGDADARCAMPPPRPPAMPSVHPRPPSPRSRQRLTYRLSMSA